MMTEQSNVTQQAISDRLGIRNIEKFGKWLLHKLKEWEMDKKETICKIMLLHHERKVFFYRVITDNENWYILRILNPRSHG